MVIPQQKNNPDVSKAIVSPNDLLIKWVGLLASIHMGGEHDIAIPTNII